MAADPSISKQLIGALSILTMDDYNEIDVSPYYFAEAASELTHPGPNIDVPRLLRVNTMITLLGFPMKRTLIHVSTLLN